MDTNETIIFTLYYREIKFEVRNKRDVYFNKLVSGDWLLYAII